MKPSLSKNRALAEDPLQLDFLSRVQPPPPPMKPIEASPDGTPPLPFLTPAPESRVDVFEADPFFNPPAPLAPVTDGPPPDELPADPAPPVASTPAPPASAEERLLERIMSQPDETEATRAQGLARELRAIRIRCAALETELNGARLALDQAHLARTETETRFEQAEKQWTGKLSQLRQMLDEVEDARDDVFQKRVPKLLFIGTLIAGIVATLFAYLIGAGQSTPAPVILPEPAPTLAAGIPLPLPVAPPAAPLEPVSPTPPPAPVLMPELGANPPPRLKAPVNEAPPPKPAPRPAGKSTAWPALSGSRWNTVSSARELKVVFHYGIFTRGTELSSAAREDLSHIASALKGQPFLVEVEGHTDSTRNPKTKGNGKSNQALGLARAKVVARYLIDAGGLPAASVTTSSAGETQPPYPNTSEANQQKNRTVVLKISPR